MDALNDLVTRLEGAFSDRLVSVVLYGSAAEGDEHRRFSDLNVLCVLKQITLRELAESEPILHWWRQQGYPAPLLMSEDEAYTSADSFPIEFGDMQKSRKVLHGIDVIADLVVHPTHYRAQVEHELKSKLFRLRQQAAEVLSDSQALLLLCVDSVSTFCVLGRHALQLAGVEVATEKRAVMRRLGETIKMDVGALDTLLDIREEKAGVKPGDPVELFARYLECVRRMVEFIDRLEDKR